MADAITNSLRERFAPLPEKRADGLAERRMNLLRRMGLAAMIIDSAALIAILRKKPDRKGHQEATQRRMSAANWL